LPAGIEVKETSMPDPDYKALCAELTNELQGYKVAHPMHCRALLNRARAALAQPEPVAPKPVVDYSRVPEIATEAQIRSAAQYLVKKRNCDGDLIPAIEYAIARWGTPANNTGGTHFDD
jgi:predicted nicotinamide N-methyase